MWLKHREFKYKHFRAVPQQFYSEFTILLHKNLCCYTGITKNRHVRTWNSSRPRAAFPDPVTDMILRQRFFHLHMKGSKLLFGIWHSTALTQMLTATSPGWTGQPKHILPPQHLMVIAFSFFIGKFVGEKKSERPHTAVWQHKQAK